MIPLPSLAAVRGIAFAVGLAIAAAGGWKARGWKEDAARLEAERVAHATYVATADAWAAAMEEIGRQRAEDQQQAADDRRTWQRRLKDATRPQSPPLLICGTGLVPARPDDPGLPARLSAAFVRLLNDAHCIGLPAPLRAAGDHGGCPAPGAAAER